MRRTRTLITGLLALTAILALLLGVPAMLVHLADNPIPHQLPDWSQVWTRWVAGPADGSNWMPVLQIVGWRAWAVCAASIVLETIAQLRHVRPPRIPIAGHTVAAVLALATITATSTGAATNAVAHETGVTHVGTGTVATATHTPTAPRTATGHPGTSTTLPTTQTVTRQVPLQITVNQGDSLWKIATEQLGDGAAYPQLYAAISGATQPHGQHLSNPDIIQPGWRLTVPGKTTTITETVAGPAPAATTHADSALPTPGPQIAPVNPSPVPAPGTASPGAPGGGGAAASAGGAHSKPAPGRISR